ncbi:MAG TPA: tetratricopeptide repeat protein, partial [Kofleriaceae bacterium]|nr:tetratricopeptide repeat protein [Kofleriaceae bacterium]
IAAFTKGYKTEEHVDVVTDLNAPGVVRARQKRYDDALAIYARSRAILTKIQGPDSSLMADTVTRIGSTHLEAGKPASAVAALEEALAMRLAGKAGPAELSWTKLELAKALALTGNKPRAIALATEARADADAAGDTAQSTDAASWLAAQ